MRLLILEKATPRSPSSSPPCMGTVTPSSPASIRREASDKSVTGRTIRLCTNQPITKRMGMSMVSRQSIIRLRACISP